MEEFKLTYETTFPAEVTATNGTKDGMKVTWNKTVADLKNDVADLRNQIQQMKECLNSLCQNNQENILIATGTNDVSTKPQLSISPNPTHSTATITISANDKLQSLIVKITDVSGKTIRSFNSKSLTEKILVRPRLIERIRKSIPDGYSAHMACFNVTHHERNLAVQLGIPIFGCDPDLLHLGSKSNSRKIFRECGIPVPAGFEDLYTKEDIVNALAELKSQNPSLRKAVIKMNDAFSGEGNLPMKQLLPKRTTVGPVTPGEVFVHDTDPFRAMRIRRGKKPSFAQRNTESREVIARHSVRIMSLQ